MSHTRGLPRVCRLSVKLTFCLLLLAPGTAAVRDAFDGLAPLAVTNGPCCAARLLAALARPSTLHLGRHQRPRGNMGKRKFNDMISMKNANND